MTVWNIEVGMCNYHSCILAMSGIIYIRILVYGIGRGMCSLVHISCYICCHRLSLEQGGIFVGLSHNERSLGIEGGLGKR